MPIPRKLKVKMTQADQRDLLARAVLCMLRSHELKLKIPKEIMNFSGWYITYSTGRDWQTQAQALVDFVSNAELPETKGE